MENAVKEGWLDIVQFLSEQEEVDLPYFGGRYFFLAVQYNRKDIVQFLLDLEEVGVDAELMEDLFEYNVKKEMMDALEQHPKTREYVLAEKYTLENAMEQADEMWPEGWR